MRWLPLVLVLVGCVSPTIVPPPESNGAEFAVIAFDEETPKLYLARVDAPYPIAASPDAAGVYFLFYSALERTNLEGLDFGLLPTTNVDKEGTELAIPEGVFALDGDAWRAAELPATIGNLRIRCSEATAGCAPPDVPPIATPTAPAEPAPPQEVPLLCAAGFTTVAPSGADPGWCAPPPTPDCAALERAAWPYDAACEPIAPCPSGAFADEVTEAVFVVAGRANGAGTRQDPYGTIAEALVDRRAPVIALGAGRYDEPIVVNRDRTLVAKCPGEVVLAGAIQLEAGAALTIARATIEGDVTSHGALTLRSFWLDGTATFVSGRLDATEGGGLGARFDVSGEAVFTDVAFEVVDPTPALRVTGAARLERSLLVAENAIVVQPRGDLRVRSSLLAAPSNAGVLVEANANATVELDAVGFRSGAASLRATGTEVEMNDVTIVAGPSTAVLAAAAASVTATSLTIVGAARALDLTAVAVIDGLTIIQGADAVALRPGADLALQRGAFVVTGRLLEAVDATTQIDQTRMITTSDALAIRLEGGTHVLRGVQVEAGGQVLQVVGGDRIEAEDLLVTSEGSAEPLADLEVTTATVRIARLEGGAVVIRGSSTLLADLSIRAGETSSAPGLLTLTGPTTASSVLERVALDGTGFDGAGLHVEGHELQLEHGRITGVLGDGIYVASAEGVDLQDLLVDDVGGRGAFLGAVPGGTSMKRVTVTGGERPSPIGVAAERTALALEGVRIEGVDTGVVRTNATATLQIVGDNRIERARCGRCRPNGAPDVVGLEDDDNNALWLADVEAAVCLYENMTCSP